MNNQNTKDQISLFASELIGSITSQPVKPETQVKLQQALEKRVIARLLRIILDNTDEQVLVKVKNQISDQTPPDQSLELIANHIPDFEAKVVSGLASLHDEIKKDLQDLVDLFQKLEGEIQNRK